MLTRSKISILSCLIFLILSCGRSGKEGNVELQKKKDELQKLLTEKNKLDTKIQALQEEIFKLDTSSKSGNNICLVALSTVTPRVFDHFIDLRGRIDAEDISYITPRGMGGQVKQIYIKEGDVVHKGQLLLKLDDAILKQSYQAAKQQLEALKTQLQFAQTVYERQNNLWQKGIGTEIQVVNARSNKETLENQLKTAQEQVQVMQEQLNTTSVYSDVDGVAETVMIKVGELFAGMGQIKIVNTSKLKATAIVPENYITRVKEGTPVSVEIKEAGKIIPTQLSLVGQTIENTQRGFHVEAKISADKALKPNQSAVMRILDYHKDQAIVIPVNTIQSDEANKYVFVAEKNTQGNWVAKKKVIVMGEVYADDAEIISGLTGNEQLVTAGYQNVYEGQQVQSAQ